MIKKVLDNGNVIKKTNDDRKNFLDNYDNNRDLE